MNKKSFIILIAVLFAVNFGSFACTNFLITKGASANGSTMISYNADSHELYGELYHWAATDWPAGTMLDVYEWDTGKFLGQIPQISHTYNVVGNMNEFQLSIGETTYGGRKELSANPQKGAIIDYGSLIYITLQRAKNAREAIKIMGELVEKYGYYSSGESFSIADPNEVWILEMIGKGENEKGAVWTAVKIPDGYISGHANQARITTFPIEDEKNCIHSDDVVSFAKKQKWYKGKDEAFSFSDTYAPVDFEGARFCEVRVWSMFKDVNKDMQQYFDYAKGTVQHKTSFKNGKKNPNGYATNRMPLFIKPDHKISQLEVMAFMGDHLEGTELDMSKDAGAGSYGLPYRWRPLTWELDGENYCNERATGTQQTGFTFVAEMRSWLPNPIGGILWFGMDDAASTVYTPMYCGMTRSPKTFAKGNGNLMEWSDNSAFWVFNQVSNYAYTRYNLIHPEIDSLKHLIEKQNTQKVLAIDKGAEALYKINPDLAVEFITDFSVNTADALTYRWKDFYTYLFMKYMDGNVKTVNPGHQNPNLSQPGYSKDFYKKVVEDTKDKLLMPEGSVH